MQTLERQLIGTLEINEELILTDPCYEPNTWCTAKANVPFGTYNCFAEYTEGRVANIEIVKEGHEEYFEGEYIADLGVDSGQLGMFCTSKYRERPSKEVYMKSLETTPMCEGWETPYDEEATGEDSFYNCCGNYTLSTQQCGILEGIGFVSSSGWGDGVYQFCYLYNCDDETEVVGLKVLFIGEN